MQGTIFLREIYQWRKNGIIKEFEYYKVVFEGE